MGQRKWNQSTLITSLYIKTNTQKIRTSLVGKLDLNRHSANKSYFILHCKEHSNPPTSFDLKEVHKLSSFCNLATNSRLSRHHKPNGMKLNYTLEALLGESYWLNVDFSGTKHWGHI